MELAIITFCFICAICLGAHTIYLFDELEEELEADHQLALKSMIIIKGDK